MSLSTTGHYPGSNTLPAFKLGNDTATPNKANEIMQSQNVSNSDLGAQVDTGLLPQFSHPEDRNQITNHYPA